MRDRIKKNFLGYSILWIFSLIYFLLIKAREILYSLKIMKQNSLNTKIICIGNLNTGGTGKTSIVIMLAKKLHEKNKKIAIVTRGYKRKRKTKDTLIISKENLPEIEKSGDEAMLIFDSLKEYDIPILINPNRYEACLKARELFKPDLILLDDGFQHMSLKRDMNIILISANQDLHDSILPLGDLREPFSALKRADAVIITHSELASEEKIEAITNKIKNIKNIEIYRAIYKAKSFYDATKCLNLDIEKFANKKVFIFSAIGDPDSFEKNLKELDLIIAKNMIFPDHYLFKEKDLYSISQISQNLPIITTYKDFFKLPQNWKKYLSNRLYIFSIEAEIINSEKKQKNKKDSPSNHDEIKLIERILK